MAKTAIDFLKKMPHAGPHDELVNAVKAVGFCVIDKPSTTLVMSGDAVLAVIRGDAMTLEDEVIELLAGSLSPTTPEQGKTFDRVLFRLERDKIAVHEAGHVVAADALGLKLCYARLGDVCEVQLCDDHDTSSLDYSDAGTVEDMQEFFAAGAAAEKIVLGFYRPHGPAEDKRNVHAMERLKLQRQAAVIPDSIDVFDECVERIQPKLLKTKILAIAEALQTKGFLSRGEIELVLQRLA